MLTAAGVSDEVLGESAADWGKIPAFMAFESFIKSIPLVNDASERAVRKTVLYANVGPKTEVGFQNQLQVAQTAIAHVPHRDTKAALVAAYQNKDDNDKT